MASLKDAYIGETLQPLTADLARDALHSMPEAPADFIVQWLRQRVPNHEAPMSLRRRNEALKQEMSALQGSLASKITKEKPAGLADCTDEDCDMDMPFAMAGLPQMQAPFKQGELLQYQPRTDTWEKVLVLLGPGILETFAEPTKERQARLMLGATGSAKIEHEKLPPEFEGYAIEVSNFVQAEPALTHLCLAAPTEEERREWLLAINGHAARLQFARHHTPQAHQSVLFGSSKMLAHRVSKEGLCLSPTKTTMLLCKMGATIATLYAELQRLKSGAGLAPAKPEGRGMRDGYPWAWEVVLLKRGGVLPYGGHHDSHCSFEDSYLEDQSSYCSV
ncbi:Pclo [Symbiodinium sp. CCMP2592]|nr:Pclo [Symbiodinium sp. CCMP2592]